jgi:hypothetical protein
VIKIRSTSSFRGYVSRRSHVADLRHVKELYKHEKILHRQNSAAMFLTHVSPASLLDGSSRRIRIEYKLCRGSRFATHYSKALKEGQKMTS